MNKAVSMICLCLCAASSVADDAETTAAAPAAQAANSPAPAIAAANVPQGAASPNITALSTQAAAPAGSPASTAPGDVAAARFSTDAKWQLAGYNNDEVVYTIVVTNQDTRIIRCMTELQGSYFENGKKMSIADRQSSTVFPDQQVQVGNWMGMDEKSGATYSVKCHAV